MKRGLVLLIAVVLAPLAVAGEPQIVVARVEQMPRVPQRLHIIDWKKTARDYYTVLFNPECKGVGGNQQIPLAPDQAAVIVFAPVGGTISRVGNRTLIDGVVVNWRTGPVASNDRK